MIRFNSTFQGVERGAMMRITLMLVGGGSGYGGARADEESGMRFVHIG